MGTAWQARKREEEDVRERLKKNGNASQRRQRRSSRFHTPCVLECHLKSRWWCFEGLAHFWGYFWIFVAARWQNKENLIVFMQRRLISLMYGVSSMGGDINIKEDKCYQGKSLDQALCISACLLFPLFSSHIRPLHLLPLASCLTPLQLTERLLGDHRTVSFFFFCYRSSPICHSLHLFKISPFFAFGRYDLYTFILDQFWDL